MMTVLRQNEYGCLRADFTHGNPILHLRIDKWSHTIFKKIVLPMWTSVLEELRIAGHKGVYALIPETETKIIKFHEIMGMHIVGTENGYVLTGRAL